MNNLLNTVGYFTIFGIKIQLYGLMIALGMVAGVLVAIFICKKKGYPTELPIDLAIFALPCAIIGARLYFCIFNGVGSFFEIFEIWNGGLAIYGGVIGGFVGIVIACWIKKFSLVKACDLASPCLILGQSIGRIGCYFAGCCYGVETTIESFKVFPLSVQIGGVWHLSTFFYESFFDLLGFVLLLIIALKTNKKGIATASYLITYGIIRAFLEGLRDDSASLFLGNTGIKVSQLLSILLAIAGIVILVLSFVLKRKSKEAK